MKLIPNLLRLSAFGPLLAGAGWIAYGAFLQATLPAVEIRDVASLDSAGQTSLPFYELMSPIPDAPGLQVIPKLEYRKGPPQRFLERISLSVQEGSGVKSRIVYFGRRTDSNPWSARFLPDGPGREALWLEAALRLSQGSEIPLGGWRGIVVRPLLLREAHSALEGVAEVEIMSQAGVPAFLFVYKQDLEREGPRARALFFRRNSLYRVEYFGASHVVDPSPLFRRSFLVERRADALAYLAQNLSEIQIREKKAGNGREFSWPLALLAANLSVDPASLDSYFHLAGVSAMLLREGGESQDTETIDILRGNILSAEFYARDIDPNSQRTSEISRLARLLTRNFE